jgi:hypothetical protein
MQRQGAGVDSSHAVAAQFGGRCGEGQRVRGGLGQQWRQEVVLVSDQGQGHGFGSQPRHERQQLKSGGVNVGELAKCY